MGPQLDSCGREYAQYNRLYDDQLASMGPQLDSCGRQRMTSVAVQGISSLQWGRNLTVAEGLDLA